MSDTVPDTNLNTGLTRRLYDLATGEDEARLCRDIPDSQCREEPRGFVAQIFAQALSKSGDALADPRIVLPWLLGTVGAPAFFIGLLVPIRESLALLPQILIGSVIRRYPVRKWFWIGASVVEGACVLSMGLVALAGMRGSAAGWAIAGLLVLFSLARGVASIASKDTLGKTVSKGRRGRVGGYAGTVSGLVAGAVGLYLVLSPAEARPESLLYALIVAAGVSWFAAALAFTTITEHPGATDGGRGIGDLLGEQVSLLFSDRQLQLFLAARTLMISTSLTGPIYVALAQRETGNSLDSLGWLILASGLAGTLSSSFWGLFSDRSSRATMAAGAGIAAALGFAVVGVLALSPAIAESRYFYAAALFVLGISHAGVRIGRKTHIVDMAGQDRKAEYVALSNTIIGVFLLVIGAVAGALMSIGLEIAIVVLAALALAGAVTAMILKNVQA
ncbi:MAG: MFS transporter [Alphaproteobacteria bacterium]